MFNNKKWGSPSSFLSYKHLKPKLRVLLTGYPVAMVTSDVRKMTATYVLVIEHLFDTIIVASNDKVQTRQSVRAGKFWKPIPATLNGQKS